jgi:hypothetical protein
MIFPNVFGFVSKGQLHSLVFELRWGKERRGSSEGRRSLVLTER